MAILKAKEARKLTVDELKEKVGELRTELLRARAKKGKRVREIRRTIARLLTLIAEKLKT